MDLFSVYDDAHCEIFGSFETFDSALLAVHSQVALGWAAVSNRPPCKRWKGCCRKFSICEYDGQEPSKVIATTRICTLRWTDVDWHYNNKDEAAGVRKEPNEPT